MSVYSTHYYYTIDLELLWSMSVFIDIIIMYINPQSYFPWDLLKRNVLADAPVTEKKTDKVPNIKVFVDIKYVGI